MNNIHKKIQLSGGRMTKARKAIIDVLSNDCCFLTKTELVERLKLKKIKPDRSTIYRELQFLIRNNFLIQKTIAGVDYFEIPKDYHHHLVCVGCNSISGINLVDPLRTQGKKIEKNKKFKIINHPLEFYGYCRKCQA